LNYKILLIYAHISFYWWILFKNTYFNLNVIQKDYCCASLKDFYHEKLLNNKSQSPWKVTN